MSLVGVFESSGCSTEFTFIAPDYNSALFILVGGPENQYFFTRAQYNLTVTIYDSLDTSSSSLLTSALLSDARLEVEFEDIEDFGFDISEELFTYKSAYFQQNKISVLRGIEDLNFAIILPEQDTTGLSDLFILVERNDFDSSVKNYLLNANGYLFEWDGNTLNRDSASFSWIDLNRENLISFSGHLPSGDYRVLAAYIDDGSELKVIGELDIYTAH